MEMTAPSQLVCRVAEASDVGSVRRQTVAFAASANCGDATTGHVALIATELATNLVRHTDGGRLLVQWIDHGAHAARELELLSLDTGPGMNVAECLRDGFSSAGTAGEGLGAVQRASGTFEAYSQPGKGTVVLSRVKVGADSAGASTEHPWRWGVISTPAPGETVIGDCWRLLAHGADTTVLMADGLGHGPLANEASEAAARVFEAEAFGDIPSFFTRAHVALRPTRGAAVAVAVCPGASGTMHFAGAGNISASVVTRAGATRHLMSHNGTVGAQMRPAHPLPYAWGAGDRLVIHSDGLSARWSLAEYPNILQYHPAILNALLYRDHRRDRDDATVLVLERVV